MKQKLRSWARNLKMQTLALYFAVRDPRTPLPVKMIAWLVVAYALSPIDLIPDFIPVLGLLDDLIIVPIGIYIALKFVPPEVMADARARADRLSSDPKPRSYWAAVVIVLVWLSFLTLAGYLFLGP
ncbi:MAG: DUF1232 domain-containing protein [Nitrospirae bacterium]|nr:DUF1232 domain-containing protein [Nitrospirota bacterium]